MPHIFTGAGVALVTPMKEDFSIHFERLEELIEDQIANRTDAIIIAGTTGESAALSFAEHCKLVDFAVKTVHHRIPVIAGAGSNNTAHAIELTKACELAGADALLAVTPYYNKTSQQGLVAHFTACAKATSLPIILYNVPSRTGVNILPSTYQKLCENKNIVATKEASGNISQIAEIAARMGDRLDIYSGNDDQTVPILSLGGKGVISVLSNLLPREMHAICQTYLQGNTAESRALQLKYLPLMQALFADVNPIPIKYAMNYCGMQVGPCRLPLCQISETAKQTVCNCLENLL